MMLSLSAAFLCFFFSIGKEDQRRDSTMIGGAFLIEVKALNAHSEQEGSEDGAGLPPYGFSLTSRYFLVLGLKSLQTSHLSLI